MNKKITKLLSVFVIAGVIGVGAAFTATGCNKGNDDQNQTQTDAVTGVTATASKTSAAVGDEITLSATVTGTGSYSTEVTWAITEGGSYATLSGNKLTATAAGTVKVQATSVGDTTKKSAEVTITITAAQTTEPTVTTVTVKGANNATTVANGGTLQLSATVTGTNNPAQTVTWSIKSGATATGATIGKDGVLSAGTVAGKVTVVATSTVDTTKSGELEITVQAAELNLAIEISGNQTVPEGGTIQLTATVSGVPDGGESGVTWSIDDTAVATIDQNGLVTAVGAGMATVTATSKLDSTVDATYDIIVTAATRYDQLANRSDNLLKENFSSYTEGAELTVFDDWGTVGVYEKGGKVSITGGQAKAQTTEKLDNISLMIDFGAVEGVVEGYFEYSFLAAPGSGNGNSINFYNGSEKVLTIMGHAAGAAYTIENIPGVAAQPTTTLTCDTTSTIAVEFKFDLTNKKVTLKLNDTAVCTDLECGIDVVTGLEVVTSNGGQRGVVVDNIAVCGTELTVATQRTRVAAKIAALETEYGLTAKSYYADIKTAYTTAAEAATTISAVDAAYDTFAAALLSAMQTDAKATVDGLWTTGYTHDAALITELKTAIKGDIDAAKTLAGIQALITNEALAARLEAKGIHPDEYYAAVEVTLNFVEKTTGASAGSFTDKSGVTLTLDELKSKVTVPAANSIVALYTDAEGQNAIAGNYTLDAGASTAAVSVTIYVEFEAAAATESWLYQTANATISAENPDIAKDEVIASNGLFEAKALVEAKSGHNQNASFESSITNSSNVPTATAESTASGEALTFTNAVAFQTKAGTGTDYVEIKANAAITVYVYINVSDDKHGSNRAGAQITYTVNGVAGTPVEAATRKNVPVVAVTLKQGDTLVIGASQGTATSDPRVWLYGIEAVQAQ